MIKIYFFLCWMLFASSKFCVAQTSKNFIETSGYNFGFWLLILVCFVPIIIFIWKQYLEFRLKIKQRKLIENGLDNSDLSINVENLNSRHINTILKLKYQRKNARNYSKENYINKKLISLLLIFMSSSIITYAQNGSESNQMLMSQPGIIITIILMLIPLLLGIAFAMVKVNNAVKTHLNLKKMLAAEKLAAQIIEFDSNVMEDNLVQRKAALDYSLSNKELSGTETSQDTKGLLQNINDKYEVRFTEFKKKATPRPTLDADITNLIIAYFGCAAFWLVIGSGIGEYVGIKFVVPDADHISWLSFGRLRPVHTNIVFWGWASLGMIGLGYYVVPTVSNTKIYSIKWGWIGLVLTNIMVVLGTICLMAGLNNGGGEFREYIWPVMAFFAVALILTLANFILTVAKRTTKEIYISNWYIISAIIFTIIVALTAYLPFWQDGVSETIVQGYFMHSGVGMWFTLFTLGLLYYFIPQQINKPIYAYSLGILAFWTQIIFYTIIGTHHFIFAPIPWWLQTVGIVGSAGMIIPVVAASINFIVTFKGQWSKVSHSYTLPFFLVAVIYYFIVSMQGTAEAFKFTNLIWHFTDFTVAHAHLGFYGIITFTLWGGMYAILPRLTGKEPPQHLVGSHFWFAFIGLLFYVIPLSIGATLRGLMWMEGKPFIDSVIMMFDFWLWRAIGGSLMFISHLIFFYNFYKMINVEVEEIDIKEKAFEILEKQIV